MATDYVVTINRDDMTYECLGSAGGFQAIPMQDLLVQFAYAMGCSGTITIRADLDLKTVEVVNG